MKLGAGPGGGGGGRQLQALLKTLINHQKSTIYIPLLILQNDSNVVSTNMLQNLLTNFLSKVPRRFWYSAEPEKPSKSVVEKSVQQKNNNNNIYDPNYFSDQVNVFFLHFNSI